MKLCITGQRKSFTIVNPNVQKKVTSSGLKENKIILVNETTIHTNWPDY